MGEDFIHDVVQYGTILGLLAAMFTVWREKKSVIREDERERTNIKRDIEELKKDFSRLKERDDRIFTVLSDIEKKLTSILTRVVKVETKLGIEDGND